MFVDLLVLVVPVEELEVFLGVDELLLATNEYCPSLLTLKHHLTSLLSPEKNAVVPPSVDELEAEGTLA